MTYYRKQTAERHGTALPDITSSLRGYGGAATVNSQSANVAQPTILDLLHLAITETDFTGDLTNDQRLLEINVENSIDLAATIWEERHNDIPVPLSLIQWARCALLLEAEAMLRDRARYEADTLADAREAGDLDAEGQWIPYDTYRRA